LERRDSRFGSDELKVPKTYRALGVKSEETLKWDWRGEKVHGGVGVSDKEEDKRKKDLKRENKKDETDEKRGL